MRRLDPPQVVVTTFRIKPAHWRALHDAAVELALVQGGRPDASAALRGVLDAWLARARPRAPRRLARAGRPARGHTRRTR